MSSAGPVADESLAAQRLSATTHGGRDGLSAATTENPMHRVRRPVTSPEHEQSSAAVPESHQAAEVAPAHDSAGASTGWRAKAGRFFSGAGEAISGAASSAWSGMKWMGSKVTGAAKAVPGLLSRGFQGTRSGIKSAADDYSQGVDTVAQHSIDPVMNLIGTKKFDPKINVDSLGWKSRAKNADGVMEISDPIEKKMAGAISGGHDSVKSALHDSNSGLSDDDRADMVRKHLMATHKLKQSGEGGLYDKALEREKAKEATTDSARAGQVAMEASEGAIRLASSGAGKMASDLGTAVTGVSVANVVKHGAMLAKIAGQSALEKDSARVERAEKAQTALEDTSAAHDASVGSWRDARKAWAGKSDDEMTDDMKAARTQHVRSNFQTHFAKLKANKESYIAKRLTGDSDVLDEMKMKHTTVIDKKTEQVAERDPSAPDVDHSFGMPMGNDTTMGKVGQRVRSVGEGLEFGGKMVTGTGAQSYLDKGDHASAAAIAGGALATEAGTAIAAGLAPGGGHAVKSALKGAGYAAIGTGKLMAVGGNKAASKQDQHDRYQDVVTGKRKADATVMPINFQGAQSNHDPGGLVGAFEKTRDGIADGGKSWFRKLFGAKRSR